MASLSQRDAKTRNEAGVPLIFLESVWICKVWIGFPWCFYSGSFDLPCFFLVRRTFYASEMRNKAEIEGLF